MRVESSSRLALSEPRICVCSGSESESTKLTSRSTASDRECHRIRPGVERGWGSQSRLPRSSGESISGDQPICTNEWGIWDDSTRRSARRRQAMGHQSASRRGDGEVSLTKSALEKREMASRRWRIPSTSEWSAWLSLRPAPMQATTLSTPRRASSKMWRWWSSPQKQESDILQSSE